MFPTHESNELTLVETIAGLCSYYNPPSIRNQTINSDSRLIDEIALQFHTGELEREAITDYAPHLSGLQTSPLCESSIRGNWDEYNKGMIKFIFRVGRENYITEYYHVLGFVTENDLVGELSENAVFVPICSWRETQTISGSVNGLGRTTVSSTLSRRNDYIFNDGTLGQQHGWTTIRPTDILAGVSNKLTNKEIVGQISATHGIEEGSISMGEATSSLRLTTVMSKRGNNNPTLYSEELLSSIAKTNADMKYSLLENKHSGVDYRAGDVKESDYYQTSANSATKRETKAYQDPFLMAILDGQSLGGFRGIRIRDFVDVFPNFPDTIPENGFELLDENYIHPEDYKAVSRLFGTSSFAETIASEIAFNILDVMTLNGLNVFHCVGSNIGESRAGHIRRECDDAMGNIDLVPTHYVPMADGDIEVHQRADYACDDIKEQIMTKLNGRGFHVATPIRFEVKSELMGTTLISIELPTDEDPYPEPIEWPFPTYAFSRFSPILTTRSGHGTMSDGIYKNLSSYLRKSR